MVYYNKFNYLLTKVKTMRLEFIMGKITMQDIANELDISRVSVWKVINNKSGVSDTLTEKVISKAKELGYFINKPSKSTALQTNKTIAVIVSRPESATFWTNILFQISNELAKHNINLMYASLPSIHSLTFTLPTMLMDGTVDAAIILNVYDTKILSKINQLKLPKVYLDITPDFPTRELTGDLFLIEGYETLQKITKDVISKGHTEIGFIGDTQYAQTNNDRFQGFKNALKDHNLPIRSDYCLTSSIDIFSYYEQMTTFFDALDTLPTAFVCASDYVASFLFQYFADHPEKLNHDLFVTGFDGSTEYLNVSGLITTAYVNTQDLGKRLAYQIKFREENPRMQYELTYLYPEIIYRDYTLKVK